MKNNFSGVTIHTNESISAHRHQYYSVFVPFYSILVFFGVFYTPLSHCRNGNYTAELFQLFRKNCFHIDEAFKALYFTCATYEVLAQCSVHGQNRRQPNTGAVEFSAVYYCSECERLAQYRVHI